MTNLTGLILLGAFAVSGIPLNVPEGPQIAPVDISAGEQTIALRGPLVARTPGARLVLFVRDMKALDGLQEVAATSRNDRFEQLIPRGSVRATLRTEEGKELTLEHTDYAYYRGFAGLVLTEREPGERRQRYNSLSLTATHDLPLVRFVWLDQLTRTLRDVPPPR